MPVLLEFLSYVKYLLFFSSQSPQLSSVLSGNWSSCLSALRAGAEGSLTSGPGCMLGKGATVDCGCLTVPWGVLTPEALCFWCYWGFLAEVFYSLEWSPVGEGHKVEPFKGLLILCICLIYVYAP